MLPIFHQTLGGVLVVVGIVLTPTPVPFGLILLTIGLTLLAPYMPFVQKIIRSIRRKYPRVNAELLRRRDRLPDVIRRAIDATHPAAPAE